MSRVGLLVVLCTLPWSSQDAERDLRQALELLAEGKAAAACELLAEREGTLEARAHLALGVARHRLGEMEGAARSFRDALDSSSDQVVRRARFNLARTCYDRALARWPEVTTDSTVQSRAHEVGELLREARAELQLLLLEDPGDRDVRESLEAVSHRLARLAAGSAADGSRGAEDAADGQTAAGTTGSEDAGGAGNGGAGTSGQDGQAGGAAQGPGLPSLQPRPVAEVRRLLEAIEQEARQRLGSTQRRLPPAGGSDW